MVYRSYIPAAPLSCFVERFWYSSDAPAEARGRVLPSGTMELVINLREDQIRIFDPSVEDEARCHSGAVVAGAYSRYFEPYVHESVIGVHFRPGGAAALLGVPAGELADSHVDLELFWGAAARETRERLCEAATPEARFSLLEEILLERLRRSPERHPAVSAALAALTHKELSIGEIAREIGICQRRLIQVFTSSIGLTPKRFQRVCRFHRVRDLVGGVASPEWGQIALDCGYFDQSHLIRDFRQFTGFSPAEFERAQNENLLPAHIAQIA
jgi:AraC-like DNA-binding protein